jgi:hypothetical protein
MTVKKHDDSIKPGVGIDKDLGSDYTKKFRTDPWNSNPKGNFKSPRGAGAYQDENADFLTNKPSADSVGGEVSRDVWNEVEGQSSDSGNRKVRSRGQP